MNISLLARQTGNLVDRNHARTTTAQAGAGAMTAIGASTGSAGAPASPGATTPDVLRGTSSQLASDLQWFSPGEKNGIIIIGGKSDAVSPRGIVTGVRPDPAGDRGIIIIGGKPGPLAAAGASAGHASLEGLVSQASSLLSKDHQAQLRGLAGSLDTLKGGDNASSIFGFMMEYQRMVNKEAREDRKTARHDSALGRKPDEYVEAGAGGAMVRAIDPGNRGFVGARPTAIRRWL